MGSLLKVSPAGRKAITQREGCRLKAYPDSRGIWTIGVGHVNMTPPVTRMGMTITAAQADAYLAADLAPVEKVINTALNSTALAALTQNEFDALASLGFNIGVHGLAGSTVIRELNAGNKIAAANAFMLWDHPSVLEARRAAERTEFLTPDAPGHAQRASQMAQFLIPYAEAA